MRPGVIKCLPRSDCQGMRFWCPNCGKWHFHGVIEGDRISHCTAGEIPDLLNHYSIRMMTDEELRDIRNSINEFLSLSKEERRLFKRGSPT